MKLQYISLFVCAAAFTACQNDELTVSSEGEVAMELHTSTQIDTRTNLQNGKTVVWEEGDEIAVYDFSAPKHKFTATVSKDNTTFLGKITPRCGSFIAAYPYNMAAENNIGQSILMRIPNEQTAVQNGFASGLNLSIAEGERNVDGSPSYVTFRNVCQLFKFTIPSYAAERIASVKLSTSTSIAGDMTVGFEDHDVVAAPNSGAFTSITLYPPTDAATFAEGTYHFVLAPVDVPGFTLTLTDIKGKVYTQHSSTTLKGISGFIFNLGNLDLIDKPVITPQHVYQEGLLVGTTLSLTTPTPDKPWSAVVKNASGAVVRTLAEGSGTLTSAHTDATWPYLPNGNYTVEYEYTTANGKTMKGNTTFQITEKPQFSVTTTAASSYTYYIADDVAKDIDKANAMDRYKVTNLSCTVNGIAETILSNSNYTVSMANNFSGTVEAVSNAQTTYEDISVTTLGENSVTASATFDGVTMSDDKTFLITGLPFSSNPPRLEDWSTSGSGVLEESDHIRLGDWNGAGSRAIHYTTVQIPAGTKMTLDYKLQTYMDNLASSQTTTIVGNNSTWFTFKEDGTGTENHEAQITVTAGAQTTEIKCTNNYGSGNAHTKVYRIGLTYAE